MELRLEDLKAQSAALGSLLESSQHADLVIRCKGGTMIKAHKSIVCAQSKFFENACKPGRFKEGQENVVILELGDSDTIKAMINFLYTAHYPANSAHRPLFHFHARMYIVADFFDIASLKKRALQMFEANAKLLDVSNCRTAFFAMIRSLYTDDAASEEHLRKIITACANRAMPMLLKPVEGNKIEILSLVEEYPALARDLVMASGAVMKNVNSVNWRLKCSHCGWVWATAPKEDPAYFDSDGDDYLVCPSCQIDMSWSEWKDCRIEGDWCQ
ncbi:hypothetical protein FKW77_004412 [Venturia effusa]|uniref:BTB domain-containing protein n=1 Tax=Venturia effusa TaxID=50376 RepID=A0A517L773_9PEZI|nr:hypothetical protein FKW77_004412 [Venturia effusa]